jgi:hypothetical protein
VCSRPARRDAPKHTLPAAAACPNNPLLHTNTTTPNARSDFVETQLPAFKRDNPQLSVVTEVVRNKFPLIEAAYHGALCGALLLGALLAPPPRFAARCGGARTWEPKREGGKRRARHHCVSQQIAPPTTTKQPTTTTGGDAAHPRGRTVGVKHLDAAAVAAHVRALRDTAGHGTRTRVPVRRVISRNPSIQGAWTVATFGHLRPQAQQQQGAAAESGSR